MPRKKRGRKKTTNYKRLYRRRSSAPIVKYRTRWKTKTITRRAKNTLLGGINISSAMKDMIPLACGALICKFAAKKFAAGGGETDNWTWKNYAWGFGGTAIAAMLSSAVFKGRGRIAQNIFEGGLLLFVYKLLTNEVAPKSQLLDSWFGEDEDVYPDMSEDDPGPGDIYQSDDQDVVYGADRMYRPVNEMHRLPAVANTSGVDIEPADPTFGDSYGVDIQPADPTFGTLSQKYKAAYGGSY